MTVLKVVALISGGKDSIYNCLEVLAENHQIVALANLHPRGKDELDSYMWQTVGHMGIEKLAEAMELPLYRRETKGKSDQIGKYYEPQSEDDEVEDLFSLLKQVKDEMQVDAVSCGAIFSDYQRVRVENVCSRLNLVSLAYLWRREQCDLLQEMIDCHIHAIVIKVASLGLTPERHLGKSIKDIQSHLQQMHEKYGMNICGEGGEYETFTLDCPLFKKRIVVEDQQIIVSSSDPVCPVGYINFTKLRLVPKEAVDFNKIVIKRSQDFLNDLNYDLSDLSDPDLSETELELIEQENKLGAVKITQNCSVGLREMSRVDSVDEGSLVPASPIKFDYEKRPLRNLESVVSNAKGWYWIAGIQGIGHTTKDGITAAMEELEQLIGKHKLVLKDLCYITMYVRNISEYQILNEIYSAKLNFQNPPTRVCVECPLPENCHVILEAVAFKAGSEVSEIEHKRNTMHVQSISHWSPANIGPYSQSTRVGDITYISGQIGLIPGTMTIIDGGIKQECKLTLRHINRIAKAMNSRGCLRDVVQGICFIIHPSYINEARRQWERRTANAIMDYIVVPALPRKALVEWQVWIHTHNDKFDYEETGCSVGMYTISLRRRWNYENNCAAVVCYVSTGIATTSITKLSDLSEEVINRHNSIAQRITQEQLNEIFKYIFNKILQGYPAHSPDELPAIHFRVFYVVSDSSPSTDLLIKSLNDFKENSKQTANLAFSLIPACSLQNASTFISILGIRHE